MALWAILLLAAAAAFVVFLAAPALLIFFAVFYRKKTIPFEQYNLEKFNNAGNIKCIDSMPLV